MLCSPSHFLITLRNARTSSRILLSLDVKVAVVVKSCNIINKKRSITQERECLAYIFTIGLISFTAGSRQLLHFTSLSLMHVPRHHWAKPGACVSHNTHIQTNMHIHMNLCVCGLFSIPLPKYLHLLYVPCPLCLHLPIIQLGGERRTY